MPRGWNQGCSFSIGSKASILRCSLKNGRDRVTSLSMHRRPQILKRLKSIFIKDWKLISLWGLVYCCWEFHLGNFFTTYFPSYESLSKSCVFLGTWVVQWSSITLALQSWPLKAPLALDAGPKPKKTKTAGCKGSQSAILRCAWANLYPKKILQSQFPFWVILNYFLIPIW